MSEARVSVTLQLELELEGDALRGRAIDAAGIEHVFTGRIGLAGLIEAMLEVPAEEVVADPPATRAHSG